MGLPLLKFWPFQGFKNSCPRTEVSPQEMTGPSLDWLVTSLRKLRRRAGSAIFGDTWSSGAEVAGILESKWSAKCRRLIAARLDSLTDNYPTVLGLVTEEATLGAAQLFFRNTNGTDSWRVVGQEWSTTHYPAAPTAQPELSVIPFVYENQWGGLTLSRLKTELERRYLCAGSREVRQFGHELAWPAYTGTPMRWNGRFNTATGSGTEKCEVFPLGLIPPLQVPDCGAGNDLGASTVGPWKGSDAFFYTLVFENERGEWSMWPIPRPPNSAWVGFTGFGYFQVDSANPTHYFDRVTFTNIACGPPGTVRKHILRTTKVDVAATQGSVFPPLNALGICLTIEGNGQTTATLDDANDLSLNFDPRIMEMLERGQQWPPRARVLGRFDGHATLADLRPNPAALILCPWKGGTVNAPIDSISTDPFPIYTTTAYSVKVTPTAIVVREVTSNNETDTTYLFADAPTLRKMVDRINTNSTAAAGVSKTCSSFTLWGGFPTGFLNASNLTNLKVGMVATHANLPAGTTIVALYATHPVAGSNVVQISRLPTAAIVAGSVTFTDQSLNTTSPALWGAGVVLGADASESCDELLRTYVGPQATWANNASTLTLIAGATNIGYAGYISPGMFITSGAWAAGTIVTAVNTTTGVVTLNANSSRANNSTDELVEFAYDTGDTAAAASSDQNGCGFVRAFGNAFPVVLYWRKSYLDQFADAIYDSIFSVASPGYAQDSINTWHRRNRHSGPAEFGPLMGVAEVLNTQLEFHVRGVVALMNPRDSDTHEDADYRKTVMDWGHGARSPYAICSGNGWAIYLSDEGIFARGLGAQKVLLSRALYDAGRPVGSRGELEYAIKQCIAASESGADTYKLHAKVLGSVLHVRYHTADSATYPNREIRYDFSASIGRQGLAEVLDDQGQPFPWSAPLTLRCSVSTLIGLSDGIHHYAAFDSNAGTADGRVDEIDTGTQDNGTAVVPVGYLGPAQPPDLNRARPVKVRALTKKSATGLSIYVARDPEKAPASSTYDSVAIGSSSADDFERTLAILPSTVIYAKEMVAVKVGDTGAGECPEVAQLEVEYQPEDSTI